MDRILIGIFFCLSQKSVSCKYQNCLSSTSQVKRKKKRLGKQRCFSIPAWWTHYLLICSVIFLLWERITVFSSISLYKSVLPWFFLFKTRSATFSSACLRVHYPSFTENNILTRVTFVIPDGSQISTHQTQLSPLFLRIMMIRLNQRKSDR